MASAFLPSGILKVLSLPAKAPSRGIRSRPERDPELASEPGRFGPFSRLRVASGLPSVAILLAVARWWGSGSFRTDALGPSGIPSESAWQKNCRRSALASVTRTLLADTAKGGASGSGVC